ncbi:MAG: medium chain dehydrogenase/reductase family protein [Bacteroidia bacterium]
MRAVFIVRNGPPERAFELREAPMPQPGAGQIRIQVEAFGLNFADVMARIGMYPDAPPLPAIVGYDVVGRVDSLGSGVSGPAPGTRVVALTRFGGYAEYAVTDARAVVPVPEDMDPALATSLATQCGTAWYMAMEAVNLRSGDQVLVQNAAGGVGAALVQLAKHRGCFVYGTAGSPAKLDYLRSIGVDVPIDYRVNRFGEVIAPMVRGRGLDVVFDALGGRDFQEGFKLLGAGGRMVAYGASSLSGAPNGFMRALQALRFGFYHPLALIGPSRALIGVNMLRLADHRPEVLADVLHRTVAAVQEGVLRPAVSRTFPVSEIAAAHAFLQGRQAMGKVAVAW